jgi:uncharacterized DUF497 family protein
MPIQFEWDPDKSESNLAKHGVRFDEATSVFSDPLSLTIGDPLHSGPGRDRFVTIGMSFRGRALGVVHSDQGDSIRIISARLASRRERATYEEEP